MKAFSVTFILVLFRALSSFFSVICLFSFNSTMFPGITSESNSAVSFFVYNLCQYVFSWAYSEMFKKETSFMLWNVFLIGLFDVYFMSIPIHVDFCVVFRLIPCWRFCSLDFLVDLCVVCSLFKCWLLCFEVILLGCVLYENTLF